jgi:hypothetical protein
MRAMDPIESESPKTGQRESRFGDVDVPQRSVVASVALSK